jgi:leucyl-tRNA---protein transferase
VDSETTLLSAPETCPYLPERVTQMRYEIAVDLTPATYMSRLDAGWRRFGPIMFRHECPACRRCQSLRIPVARFQPSAGQRRVWRKNVDVVDVRIGTPSTTREKLDLFRAQGMACRRRSRSVVVHDQSVPDGRMGLLR